MPNAAPTVYEACTDDVVVRATPIYLPSHLNPEEGRWTWAYTIEIENRGVQAVQLLARHWVITDANGRVDQVVGAGVVGEQPVIAPGGAHRYTSGCPLPTPSGSMAGSFQMQWADGERFDAEIPAFSLDVPGVARTLN
ncbi:MAG TPA: Co2+/Mg2+ efflux protein ApaG [Caulobacteraceae bacterium]|jgi:ApaG protein